ncbi:MAG: sugar ABC transporter substrate-binding lipoprotein [Phycisphaerae bacterium]
MSPLAGGGCAQRTPKDGKLHLAYWDKWTRFEGEAMKRVVDSFNRRQSGIVVHYEAFGTVERKTMISTAGGDSPDLAGLWATNMATYADRGIFTPLDEYMQRDGRRRDHWLPVFANICIHHNIMWAVPTTPATTGLHWNKAMFRAAGLDPDQPPRTVQELDDYAWELTRWDKNKENITQMGFLPQEPGWFNWAWGPWFGGRLIDGDKITANHPRNVEAFEWMQGYSRRYGVEKIKRFYSSFGNFASTQNPFFSGRIGMVLQGTWLHNYISQYAPGMQYGVSYWPQTPAGPEGFCTADEDILVIPRGLPAPRRDAAWEFVKYASSQEGMEMLNMGQRKNSPLREVSDAFLRNHPHPYIELFTEMSRSPNCAAIPQLGVWNEYQREIDAAVDRARLLQENPATGKIYTAQEILDQVQNRMEASWERHQKSLAMRPPVTGSLQ